MPQRLLTLLCLAAILLATTGCVINMPLFPDTRRSNLTLEMLEPPEQFLTRDKVLLLSLDGFVSDSPDNDLPFGEPSMLVHVKDVLDRARKNEEIRAVVLRINSPGGGVTASDLIHREILRFRNETKIPVIAICMDVAASGGYYIATAADRIILHPTTVTGSIGVIALFPSLRGLGGKIGIDIRVVKSGQYKDIGSMWREFSPEEREILQQVIDDMYARFVDAIEKGRPKLSRERILELADGRIYTAQQAVDNGLADQVAYMEDAIDAARQAAGIDDAALVAYRSAGGYRGHYYAKNSGPAQAAAPQINLLNLELGDIAPHAGPGPFYYLWMP